MNAYSRHSGAATASAHCHCMPPEYISNTMMTAVSGIHASRYIANRRRLPSIGCMRLRVLHFNATQDRVAADDQLLHRLARIRLEVPCLVVIAAEYRRAMHLHKPCLRHFDLAAAQDRVHIQYCLVTLDLRTS